MKLTILKNLGDRLKIFLAYSLEISIRTILLLLPVGLYYFMLLDFEKPTSTTGLQLVLKDGMSTYTEVAPGVYLAVEDGGLYKRWRNKKFKPWWKENFPKIFTVVRFIAYVAVIVICLLKIMGA